MDHFNDNRRRGTDWRAPIALLLLLLSTATPRFPLTETPRHHLRDDAMDAAHDPGFAGPQTCIAAHACQMPKADGQPAGTQPMARRIASISTR